MCLVFTPAPHQAQRPPAVGAGVVLKCPSPAPGTTGMRLHSSTATDRAHATQHLEQGPDVCPHIILVMLDDTREDTEVPETSTSHTLHLQEYHCLLCWQWPFLCTTQARQLLNMKRHKILAKPGIPNQPFLLIFSFVWGIFTALIQYDHTWWVLCSSALARLAEPRIPSLTGSSGLTWEKHFPHCEGSWLSFMNYMNVTYSEVFTEENFMHSMAG